MKISVEQLRSLGFEVSISSVDDGTRRNLTRLRLFKKNDSEHFVEMHCSSEGLARLDVILAHLALRYSKDIKKTLEFGRTRLSMLEA